MKRKQEEPIIRVYNSEAWYLEQIAKQKEIIVLCEKQIAGYGEQLVDIQSFLIEVKQKLQSITNRYDELLKLKDKVIFRLRTEIEGLRRSIFYS